MQYFRSYLPQIIRQAIIWDNDAQEWRTFCVNILYFCFIAEIGYDDMLNASQQYIIIITRLFPT